MPRYFFSEFFNGGRVIDDVGKECASDADARREAVEALVPAALKANADLAGKGAYSIHVTDETGRVLFIATLSVFPLDQETTNA
ncbi:hypothetical protein NGM99_21110 [Mesorhizobium sp. RP14(2022)]|uniref:DUF6894 domain-containing protein n=1 Tax=Mesorhizobium liriopis TaxID=2953882 RepID=A0ABT1CBT5_9HYPH|nr:hypothetical protein [Mesorhizobium liriopis]MCO6052292.1 hypothetical protein [Mesorhizobium liriopis]